MDRSAPRAVRTPLAGAEVELAAPITSAREVNGVEREVGSAEVRDGKLVVDSGAFEPKSFAIRLESPVQPLSPPVSRPIELPIDTATVSFDGGGGGVDFDGRGNSIPGELLPPAIACGGVDFVLGSLDSGDLGCVTCRGQEIELPNGDGERLFLLAAAVGGDTTGEFVIAGQKTEIRVADYRALMGQASHRRAIGRVRYGLPSRGLPTARSSGVDRDSPSRPAGREPRLRVLSPLQLSVALGSSGAESRRLRLPNQPRIRLFAATISSRSSDELAGPPELLEL